MKYVSEKYERQLYELAGNLMRPVGDAALGNTVELDPIPDNVVHLPPFKDPANPEMGFLPPEAA